MTLPKALGRMGLKCASGFNSLASLSRRAAWTLRYEAYLWCWHESHDDDVYIVTYPKSGTTLLQVMVNALLRGADDDYAHINDRVPWFELSARTSPELVSTRPRPRVFKSHELRHRLPRVGKVIYVARDVRSVAVSYWRYRVGALGVQESLDDFIDRFVAGHVPFGSWSRHLESWQPRRSEPHMLWLEFEEVVANRLKTAHRVAEFCKFDLGPNPNARVEAAAKACSLEQMRSLWHRLDPRQHAPGQAPGYEFIPVDQPRGWKDTLSEAQAERLMKIAKGL